MSGKCDPLKVLVATAEAVRDDLVRRLIHARADVVSLEQSVSVAKELVEQLQQQLADCLAWNGDPDPGPGPIPQPMDSDLDMGEPR